MRRCGKTWQFTKCCSSPLATSVREPLSSFATVGASALSLAHLLAVRPRISIVASIPRYIHRCPLYYSCSSIERFQWRSILIKYYGLRASARYCSYVLFVCLMTIVMSGYVSSLLDTGICGKVCIPTHSCWSI